MKGLGVQTFDELLRNCDLRTENRQVACSVFWTLGGNQVGKAAIAGWSEIIRPAVTRGARLWPFDGVLAELSGTPGVVIAETYPAEAYYIVDANFQRNESKRRSADRKSKAPKILRWADKNRVNLSMEARSGWKTVSVSSEMVRIGSMRSSDS